MERQGIHELSAAYALDALESDDSRDFEDHLAHCEDCRETVASFRDTASALAYGVEGPEPRPGLRARILAEARSERESAVPVRRRWATLVAAGVAAVAACTALALGLWAASLASRLDDRSQTFAVSGAPGSLVVMPSGEAVLVLSEVDSAPAGKTYEIWVIEDGTPRPAGLFEGGGERVAVALTRPVPDGATVAVTIEREGGVETPTGKPVLTADVT